MLYETTSKCILSICDISSTRRGSFEDFLISLTEELYENKFKHVIIFRSRPIKIVEDALLEKGAEIKVFKPSKFCTLNFLPLYNIIKETRPIIVHFHFYPIYTVINYLSLFLKIKIIYTDHMGHKNANTIAKKVARRTYYFTNSKLFSHGIEKIICVSNFVKDKYRKEYGINSKKLYVIYNGIDTNRFKKITSNEKIKNKYNINDEFVVTCVGLRKEKGACCLIKIAPIILKTFPKIKFIFVGEGEFRSHLEKQMKELGVKKHFIFVGNTDYIEEIYSISSCVVIPTLTDEAFCFVAAEAMSTETPVIAFNSGALKEVIYNKSDIIVRSPEVLADKIIECLKNQGNSRNSTKSAREYTIRNFSLNKNTCKYIELYEKLVR